MTRYSPELLSELNESEILELEARLLHEEAYQLSDDLASFVREAWKILEPVTKLSWNWHHDLICEYLTIIKQGKFKERFGNNCEGIIFNVPPRTMKSLLITVLFPVWVWTSVPSVRWMFASYADELSTEHSVARRNVIDSAWYQQRWGIASGWDKAFTFSKDQNLKTKYHNSARGQMFATAMKSAATGMGGDVLVFDDALNPKQAVSDVERARVNTDFDQVFRSRINDPATGVKIIVMQRLHEEDLTGHVLGQKGTGWVHIKLPAIAEEKERHVYPLSPGKVKEREPGQLLWSERLTQSFLDAMKGGDGQVGMGSWAFAGQYQQNPAPLEGGIIKRNWIRYYKMLPERFDFMVQSWDCTFKGSENTDFVAGQVWGKALGKYYMLPYRLNERLDFGPTKAAIKSAHALFPKAHAILIEDKANGPAIISELRQEIPGIVPVNPEGDKLSRAQAVSPVWEAGSVELPDPQMFAGQDSEHPDVRPWLEAYIHNICTFPKAAHDDDMDATSQALIYIRNRASTGMLEYVKREGQKAERDRNVTRGRAPAAGERVKETLLTANVKRAIDAGSQISCGLSQYPEIRQALNDIGTEAALAEVRRLDAVLAFKS